MEAFQLWQNPAVTKKPSNKANKNDFNGEKDEKSLNFIREIEGSLTQRGRICITWYAQSLMCSWKTTDFAGGSDFAYLSERFAASCLPFALSTAIEKFSCYLPEGIELMSNRIDTVDIAILLRDFTENWNNAKVYWVLGNAGWFNCWASVMRSIRNRTFSEEEDRKWVWVAGGNTHNYMGWTNLVMISSCQIMFWKLWFASQKSDLILKFLMSFFTFRHLIFL